MWFSTYIDFGGKQIAAVDCWHACRVSAHGIFEVMTCRFTIVAYVLLLPIGDFSSSSFSFFRFFLLFFLFPRSLLFFLKTFCFLVSVQRAGSPRRRAHRHMELLVLLVCADHYSQSPLWLTGRLVGVHRWACFVRRLI